MAAKHKPIDVFGNEDDDSEDDEPVRKRMKIGHACGSCGALFIDKKSLDLHTDKCEEDDEEGDETVWEDLAQQAVNKHADMFNAKLEDYEVTGLSDDEAKQRASDDMQATYKRELKDKYNQLLMWINGLEKSNYHKKILKDVERFNNSGSTYEKAVKLAIKKNHFIFTSKEKGLSFRCIAVPLQSNYASTDTVYYTGSNKLGFIEPTLKVNHNID